MMWLAFGALSIFWDPGMGYIFPFISIYILGYFWKRTPPFLMFLILYFHHVTALNSGFMELSLLIIAFLITEIDSLFINAAIPYGLLSIFTVAVIVFSYGMFAGIVTTIVSIAIYVWRG